MKGRLITIEGLDGSGKGTQTGLLYQALEQQGLPVKKISFPRYESDSSALVKMYLAGDFGVSENKHLVQPSHKLAAGGWEQAGYPYFCGTGIYKTVFTAEEGFRKAVLTVHTKDIATIFVNGKSAGEKLWAADKTDITKLLQPGENTIEVQITSTRANMFAAEWYPHAPYLSMTRTENGILEPMEICFE